MKNKIIYLVLLLLLSTTTTSILAQEQCGTELTQAQIDYMNAKREARKNLTSTEEDCSEYENITEVITIPMVAHIIRDDEGNGGLSTADLSIGMVNLNRAFEQVGFEFELCKINYIDNTAYTAIEYPQSTSDQYTSEEYIMATENRVAGKVNVFFIEDIGNYCGWSSFPSYVEAYDRDWTIMKNTCTTGSILAHELGHWFNLYHTHERGLTEAELVERPSEDGNDNSNCGPGVGDELCDTPADHNLYNCVNSYNCTYQCNFQDDNGDTYTPDETNIMSYSLPKCMTFFSPCQIKRMHESYLTDRSSSLCPCPI